MPLSTKARKRPERKEDDETEITPIITNRDVASPFLVEVQESAVKPIEPVFRLSKGYEPIKGKIGYSGSLQTECSQ